MMTNQEKDQLVLDLHAAGYTDEEVADVLVGIEQLDAGVSYNSEEVYKQLQLRKKTYA